MVDVPRLRVLRAVLADGSIHGAAASLGYTPSAVSQQLGALQRETGLQLVERRGRGIQPTAAGTRLAGASAGVFEALAELDALVVDLRAGRTGTVAVSYFASAGTAWIPPVVAAVTREFPGVRLDLRLVELDGGGTEPDVEVFVADDTMSDYPGYDVAELVEEPYFVVVRTDDPLAARATVPLRELREAAWVDNDVARGPCRQRVLDACATVGFAPTFRVQTQDYPSAIRFVAEGVGVTVVARLGLRDLPPTVTAVPIVDPTPTRRICLRVRRASAGNPAVRRVVEMLCGYARSAG
jgi:DNA-binding transcriptional LysR family regulator